MTETGVLFHTEIDSELLKMICQLILTWIVSVVIASDLKRTYLYSSDQSRKNVLGLIYRKLGSSNSEETFLYSILFITIFYVWKIPHKYFLLERGGVVKEEEEFKEHFSQNVSFKKIMCICHISVVKDTSFLSKISHRHDTKWIIQWSFKF